MYILAFDGMLKTFSEAKQHHIGLLGYGWLVERNHLEIAHGYGIYMRKCPAGSNIAEYLALIEGLEALADMQVGYEPIEIRGDAKCVIDQMLNLSGVREPLTQTLHRRAQKIARRFDSLTWAWVPRCENKHADQLSHKSFNYLQRSLNLKKQIASGLHFPLSGGKLIPLLDLRVHTPAI